MADPIPIFTRSSQPTPENQADQPLGPHDRDQSGQASGTSEFLRQRLHSLDAYRGLIMITLAFSGFGLAETASNHLAGNPQSSLWQTVKYHFDHVQWVGCAYWDLIQPSFMFMVGTSMAYSYAKRMNLGHSYLRMLGHSIWRSVLLIVLGIFLISNGGRSTEWSLMNVLTQMGLGYVFLFLLWGRSFRTQAIAAVVILVGTLALYMLYPHAGVDPTNGDPQVGVSASWAQENLQGVGKAWHKSANVGQAIDLWLLNQLPQTEPYRYNSGGYQTINFLPSLVTMLLGLMCGELLRSGRSDGQKLAILIVAGLGGLIVGLLLNWSGLCPLVKRIWTPTWAIFSGGWCCLILAGLYAVIDVLKLRFWAFPLVVVGMNSIAIYCMGMLLDPWTTRTFKTHLGQEIFNLKLTVGNHIYYLVDQHYQPIVDLYQPTIQAIMVGMVYWLICLWMYRNRIFIRA
jgi:predicted acyltransferase